MGTNRWPVEGCASVFDETDGLLETARGVTFSCDGTIVIRNRGTIQEVMVRLKQLSTAERAGSTNFPMRDGWVPAT